MNLKTMAVGIFIVLHGLVHLWYVVLSLELIPFKKEMGWTPESWLLSRFFPTQIPAAVLYFVAAILFVIIGIAFGLQVSWSDWMLKSAAVFSSFVLILFWDGDPSYLVEKGLIGLAINILIFWL